MINLMRSRFILFSWFVCLITGTVGNVPVLAEIENRVVAIVNDEVVTLHELNARIRALTGISSRKLR